MVNFDSYFDPPDETEDPTVDYILDLMVNGVAFDREKCHTGFMIRFANDFQPDYIDAVFEQSFAQATRIFDELFPDDSNLPDVKPDEFDDGPFDGPNPDDYFQINPERREE